MSARGDLVEAPSDLQTEVDLVSILVDRALDDIPRSHFDRCQASRVQHFSVGDEPVTDKSFTLEQFAEALASSVRAAVPAGGSIQFVRMEVPSGIPSAFARDDLRLPLRTMQVFDLYNGKMFKRFDLLVLIT